MARSPKAAIAALLLSTVSLLPAAAQTPKPAPATTVKIGFVIPSKTGEVPVHSSINDYLGEGALMGARLAESTITEAAEKRGLVVDLLYANSPSVAAAERAARRLIELDHVSVLVGGIGDGQAEALARIAAEARIPFFDIGSSSDALRGADCNRFSFHVEASDSMYVDAMAAVAAAHGEKKLFVVYEDSEKGRTLFERAQRAIGATDPKGAVTGSAAVPQGMPVFQDTIKDAAGSGADTIVLLLDPFDQIVFLEQQDSLGITVPTFAFPWTLSQTRDYIAAARYNAPGTNPRHRVALWDTTLAADGADALNVPFRSRWGESTDPTAWAAFETVQIVAQAVEATGSTKADDLVAYLESPAAVFDLHKGPGISFRPWDHQLRQPLYDVTVDQDVAWDRMSVESRIGIAGHPVPVPAAGSADPTTALDHLGNGPAATTCHF